MNLEEASKLLSVIADPNRLAIINILTKKLHVSASEFLSLVSCKQSTLSHHLSEMVNSGLIKSNKKGTKVFYSLDLRKYEQLTNFLGKVERKSSNEEPQQVKENPIRVVDTPLIKDKKPKSGDSSLPTYLL